MSDFCVGAPGYNWILNTIAGDSAAGGNFETSYNALLSNKFQSLKYPDIPVVGIIVRIVRAKRRFFLTMVGISGEIHHLWTDTICPEVSLHPVPALDIQFNPRPSYPAFRRKQCLKWIASFSMDTVPFNIVHPMDEARLFLFCVIDQAIKCNAVFPENNAGATTLKTQLRLTCVSESGSYAGA